MNENDVVYCLSQWLKSNGWNVLQDKINNNNNPIFHVKGESKKKPDLIIKKGEYINAIEVKIGDNSLPLRTNSDLIIYFCNYNDCKTFYFDNENKILSIDNFVIATYFSPDGYLKKGEILKTCSEEHLNSYFRCLNPKNEYSESFQIIRGSIWDVIKFNGCYTKYKKMTTGIGALLSTKLDGDIIGKPGFFVMKNHIRWDDSNLTWWHQWIKI